MHELNRIRQAAGMVLDTSLEKNQQEEQINEGREVPRRKSELTPKDLKTLEKRISCVKAAAKHLEQAVNSLDKCPTLDFVGEIPHYIQEIEDLLGGKKSGIHHYVVSLEKELKAFKRENKIAEFAEIVEDAAASTEIVEDSITEDVVNTKDEITTDSEIDESNLAFADTNLVSHEDKKKPLNVASDEETEIEDKDESPEQTKTSDVPSKQDQSGGGDLERKIKVPASIKKLLNNEIKEAKAEAEKQDSRNKEAAAFYGKLANAFQDLLTHIEGGTVHDIKQAQIFMGTLMGPILHKIPADVVKFLAAGGEQRSLKSFMIDVSKKYPITGPRNKLK